MRLSEKEQLIKYWLKSGIVKNKGIISAFKAIKREDFVLSEFRKEAYSDTALPILAGQTISQPTTVAGMLEALELKPGMNILEIGAGSGYNAALMAKIVGRKGIVYATEIIPGLVSFARENLKKAGIENVKLIDTDGSIGYLAGSPYDRIIVTAASPQIPEELIQQLKEGGILVIPVGGELGQTLIKARKTKGKLVKEELGEYIFVPLKGKYGYK
jgi:protein-L-isoaspartate(D-aspartate) O-methyltransferase